MSLILEALRKSEAERRRGQTPDLLTGAVLPAPAASRGRDSRPGLWVLLIAAGVAAAVGVWLWPRDARVARPDQALAAPTPGVSPNAPAPSLRRPERASAKATSPAPLHPPVNPPPPALASTVVTTAPVAPIATDNAASPASTPSEAAPATASAPTQSAITPSPAPAFASADVPLRLSELSTDERKQLPTLKVSMHMWAPEAANRFVIIDGARVGEGDRVGDATVDTIREDGVLLSWRGRHIQLPIR